MLLKPFYFNGSAQISSSSCVAEVRHMQTIFRKGKFD